MALGFLRDPADPVEILSGSPDLNGTHHHAYPCSFEMLKDLFNGKETRPNSEIPVDPSRMLNFC